MMPWAVVLYVSHPDHPRGHLLLAVSRKEDPSVLGAPGGKVELQDETPEDCADRELREETGLRPTRITEVWRGYSSIAGDPRLVVAYEATVRPGSVPRAMEPGTRVAWVPPAEIATGFGDVHHEALTAAGLLS